MGKSEPSDRQPGPLGQSDAPTCIQEVLGLILRSGHISFVEIWSWNNFYGHFLPIADTSRAVVSYWQKCGHLTAKEASQEQCG